MVVGERCYLQFLDGPVARQWYISILNQDAGCQWELLRTLIVNIQPKSDAAAEFVDSYRQHWKFAVVSSLLRVSLSLFAPLIASSRLADAAIKVEETFNGIGRVNVYRWNLGRYPPWEFTRLEEQTENSGWIQRLLRRGKVICWWRTIASHGHDANLQERPCSHMEKSIVFEHQQHEQQQLELFLKSWRTCSRMELLSGLIYVDKLKRLVESHLFVLLSASCMYPSLERASGCRAVDQNVQGSLGRDKGRECTVRFMKETGRYLNDLPCDWLCHETLRIELWIELQRAIGDWSNLDSISFIPSSACIDRSLSSLSRAAFYSCLAVQAAEFQCWAPSFRNKSSLPDWHWKHMLSIDDIELTIHLLLTHDPASESSATPHFPPHNHWAITASKMGAGASTPHDSKQVFQR